MIMAAFITFVGSIAFTPVDDVYAQLGQSFGPSSVWHQAFAGAGEIPNTGDFDGDGLTDVVTFTGDGRVYVAISNGEFFVGSGELWHGFFVIGEIYNTGDFNGDGKDDIIAFLGDGQVFVALSSGLSFGPNLLWHETFFYTGEVPDTGDFNGDGLDDVITFVGNGDVFHAASTGSSFGAATHSGYDFFYTGEVPGTGDFNGDGKDDIITFNGVGDVFVELSYGIGFGPTATLWHDNFFFAGEVPGTGDFDGDGLDDIITFTFDATGWGPVYVANSTGAIFEGTGDIWGLTFGREDEYPETGDFDGDGKVDIVNFTHDVEADVFVSLSVDYVDLDGDGYMEDFDCDDTRASVNPGADELPGNGVDDDCDGQIDETCFIGSLM